MNFARVVLCVAMAVPCAAFYGCALTSKSEAIVARYYSPATPEVAPKAASEARGELRLGRVNASAHIRENIVHRDSTYEVSSYEERRWTEKPETYVRRALANALFEKGGLKEAVGGEVPSLDVDVLAFEEVRGDKPFGRVTLAFTLHDDRLVKSSGTVTVDRPIVVGSGDSTEAIVRSIGEAMVASVEGVSERVVGEMRPR